MSEQQKSLPQRIREADLEELNDGELLEEAAYSLELADARIAALEAEKASLWFAYLELRLDCARRDESLEKDDIEAELNAARAALKGGSNARATIEDPLVEAALKGAAT